MKLEKSYKEDKALFISIKPEFVEKIFNGVKNIELRKSAPKIQIDSLVIIYCTSPVMSVIGTCRVNGLILNKPDLLWEDYQDNLGIDKESYNEYFEGKDLAVGIMLKDIVKFEKSISLSEIRSFISNFQPPQTFRYFDKIKLSKLLKLSVL